MVAVSYLIIQLSLQFLCECELRSFRETAVMSLLHVCC